MGTITFIYQNKFNNIFVLICKVSPFNAKGFPLVQTFLRISLLKSYAHLIDLSEPRIYMIIHLYHTSLKKYLSWG